MQNTQPLKKTPKNVMEKLLIDLTGQGGLYSRFFGDFPYSVGHPELAIFGAPEQYAGGVVNPIAKMGYMSPANNTFISCVSTAVASESLASASIVDEQNGFAFLYTLDGTLYRTQTLTDTSFAATTVSVSNTAGTDLAFYSAAGIRKLFFAYSNGSGLAGDTTGDIGVWDLSGLSGTGVNGNTLYIAYTSLSEPFKTGKTLTGGTSGATAHISGNYNIKHDATGSTGLLYLTSITGTFTDGETITDNQSPTPGSATTLLSGAGSVNSTVVKNFMSRYVATPSTVDGTLPQTLTSGGFTRLIVADNGYMYVLDGSLVHKYDGTVNGSNVANVSGTIIDSWQAFGIITPAVLEFPTQFTLTDALDHRGNLWITLVRSPYNVYALSQDTNNEEIYCGVYIWDRETQGTSTTDFIEVTGAKEIHAIVNFQGAPTLFTISNTLYTQIRMWDGTDFKIVAQLSQLAVPGFHDSISVSGDLMTWLGQNGQFYSYGKINPGNKSNGVYQLGDATVAKTTSSTFQFGGAIVLANANQSTSAGLNAQPEGYYLGTLDSTNAKILKWFPHSTNVNNTQQQAATGNFYSMVMPLPKLSQTHYLTIFYPPVGSGGGTTVMNVNIYINQSSSAWNGSAIPITQDDALRGYKTIPFHSHGVNFVQIGITYPASTSISIIPTPSFATIDYQPTTQLI